MAFGFVTRRPACLFGKRISAILDDAGLVSSVSSTVWRWMEELSQKKQEIEADPENDIPATCACFVAGGGLFGQSADAHRN